jgi:hypothetical protein
MSSTCEITPRGFHSVRLTNCTAYGKPRSGLTRIADHEAVRHTAQWVISDLISQQRERACRSALTLQPSWARARGTIQQFYTSNNKRRSQQEVLSEVEVKRCTACGAELILTNVVPDDTVAVRGVEHHTFICSGCRFTEHRVLFIKAGRETDSTPMPMQAARRVKPAPVEEEHFAAPGLLGRVMARLRGL